MSVIRDLLDSTKLLLNDSLATTGSNIFVGTQTLSGSIIPAADNIYDLGSPTKQWRDLYLSSASLYIDGTKVISSNTDTLTFTTDAGQSIKLLETGGDDITLQTDTGNIELKGTVEIESGKKITDSAGNIINFGDSIAVTGSIETTGTVDGIDLQAFSSSVAAGLAEAGGGASSWNELSDIPSGILSSSAQISSILDLSTVSQHILPSTTEVYDLGSSTYRWRDLYLSGSTIDLGGTKISRDSTTGDIEFKDGNGNSKSIKVEELTIGTGATVRKIKVNNGKVQFTDINDQIESAQTSYNDLTDTPVGVISGSSQVDYTSIQNTPTTITAQQASDITTNNAKVGYTDSLVKTKLDTENVVSGSSQIDYTGILNIPSGIISGSSQISITESQISDLTHYTDLDVKTKLNSEGVISGSSQIDYNSIQNQPNIPTNNNQLTNGAGYTTFTANQSVDTTSTVTFSTVTATTFTETSALRFKENIQEDIDSSIIDKLRPVSYDWKESKEKDYGFIAEEVNELDSVLTTENEDGEMLGIKYTKLIPFLVKKIQEQEERIKQLENGNS